MSDDAVSDVLGSILLVGITVALMSGISLAVLSVGGPADTLHADLTVDVRRGGDAWGDGDERVRLRHVGGEPVPQGVRVTVTVDGAATTHTPADQGFSDGVLRMGESWSVTTTITEGAAVTVAVLDPDANALVVSTGLLGTSGSGGSGSGATATFTYVGNGTTTVGSLTDLDAARSAEDGGAAATLTEASSAGAPATETRSATTVAASSGTTDPGNVLQSDDARATLAARGDRVEVEGFGLPSGASVTAVSVGFESRRSGGGASDAQLTLSYSVSGAAGATSLTETASGTSDTTRSVDVTADRAWTAQDVADLRLALVRDSIDAGFRDAAVDHLFVSVTYTLPVTDLDATLELDGVPATGTHTLQLRYDASGDAFEVQIWDGSAWTRRGTLDSAATTTFTHVLTSAEHNGGAPRVRIVDLDSGGGTGTLNMDYLRVRTL